METWGSEPKRFGKSTYIVAILAVAVLAGTFWLANSSYGPAGLLALISGKSKVIPASAESVAAANGMQILGAGDYAIARLGKNTAAGSQNLTNSIVLPNGAKISIAADGTEQFSAIFANSNSNTYIGGAGIEIHSAEESTPGKIDNGVSQRIKSKSSAPVIIEFDLPDKFYESKGSDIAQKRARFDQAKSALTAAFSGTKGKIKNDLKIINGVSADIDGAALERLRSNPTVKRVELDRTMKTVLDSSVDEIHARETWQLIDAGNNTLTGVGKIIAVVDTGADYAHQDLGGCLGANCKVIGGYDFVNKDTNPMDDNGHGTHVAATAAGKGFLNGVAPDAKILAYKVCNSGGSCWSSDIISAIDYATDPNRDGDKADHVDVGTMSLGGGGNPDDAQSLAVDNSSAAGVVWTIAAGNSGPTLSTIQSPGAARTAITVAAACKASQIGSGNCLSPIASFSSRGPLIWNGTDIQKPDIAAPGVSICAARWDSAFSTTCFDTAHVRISGTSMATPHMAGAAAIVRQAYPNYSPAEVKQHLKFNARDLGGGMTYNDQGKGEVNLKTAIPFSPKLTISPVAFWNAFSNPASKISATSSTFAVKAAVAGINTLSVSFDLNVPGVTTASNKTTLNVANGATDSFTATLTVDNDVAKAGIYSGKILFSENGTVQGAMPITLSVVPTLSVSPGGTIDYGVDDPSLSTWNSDPKTITVKNLRTDIAQAVSITPSAFATGITFQAPSSVAVPAGGSADVNTSFTVNNSFVPNGTYGGSVKLSTANGAISVPVKFVKFYVLTITGSDLPKAWIGILHAVGSGWNSSYWFGFNGTTQYSLYLNNPGTYNLIVSYNPSNEPSPVIDVFKEGIVVSGGVTTVTVSEAEASRHVKTVNVDANGVARTATGYATQVTYLPSPNTISSITFGTDTSADWLYSNISANYRIDINKSWPFQPATEFYDWPHSFTGLAGDLTFTNTPQDLRVLKLAQSVNFTTSTQPAFFTFLRGWGISGFSYANKYLTSPFTQMFYTLQLPYEFYNHYTNYYRANCPSGACPSNFQTPFFAVSATSTSRWFIFGPGPSALPLRPVTDGIMYQGLGPAFFAGQFANSATLLKMTPSLYPQATTLDNSPGMLIRQDYSAQEYDATPWSIYKDGSLVLSGNIPAYSAFFGGKPNLLSANVSATGNYEFQLDSTYPVANQNLKLQVRAKFNNALADPNPPAIKRLYYYANGARSEVYDPNVVNRLDFDLDPVGGNMSSVTASYSKDGTTFNNITVQGSGGSYSADNIPSASGLTKITLRLSGTDSSGNNLTYTFELPVGTAPSPGTPPPPPTGDTQAPTTSITSPANGATVSGTITVAATATDNVGVTKVELYANSTLLSWLSAPPYNFVWDTTSVPNGSYNLQTKAYDAVGNTGLSSLVAVTVSNATSTPPPPPPPPPADDTTPPTVAITRPINGATLPTKGSVKVIAAASDASGIFSIQIKIDSVLKTTCSLVTSCTYSWPMSKLSTGTHVIEAIATDNSANKNTASTSTTVKR